MMNEHEDLMFSAIDIYMSALKHIEELISQPTSQYGVSFEQWLILNEVVNSQEATTMTRIALERNVTKGAVARQLKPLFEQQYLKQEVDKDDRRRVILVVTDSGRAVNRKILSAVNERFSRWVNIFGRNESQQLLDLLSKFDHLIVQPQLKNKTDSIE